MPGEIGNVQADELRLKNVRTQIQNRHNSELREIQAQNGSETQRLVENQQEQLSNLKGAYEVQFSKEAENLGAHLQEVRTKNEERVIAEKKSGDQEVAKIQKANQEKIESYRKNGEAKLESARKDIQVQSDALHQREIQEARKAAKLKKSENT
ncbi:MAG: hypothetical protein H7301_05155 [Cryobacterium sp.]|nr:hypothetical protein [Oligoflexia bacterium]